MSFTKNQTCRPDSPIVLYRRHVGGTGFERSAIALTTVRYLEAFTLRRGIHQFAIAIIYCRWKKPRRHCGEKLAAAPSARPNISHLTQCGKGARLSFDLCSGYSGRMKKEKKKQKNCQGILQPTLVKKLIVSPLARRIGQCTNTTLTATRKNFKTLQAIQKEIEIIARQIKRQTDKRS